MSAKQMQMFLKGKVEIQMRAVHSPMSPALQKLLCPLCPSRRLCRAPPSSLQSLPHPDSQSRTCVAVLKLPLGNSTPCTKPEMSELPAHASRGSHLQPTWDTHAQPGVFWMLGGHLAFILPTPSSVSWISCGSLIGDLLHGNQSLPDISKGERVPLFFFTLSCSRNMHTYHHPFHLHLGDYTLQLSLQRNASALAWLYYCLHSVLLMRMQKLSAVRLK